MCCSTSPQSAISEVRARFRDFKRVIWAFWPFSALVWRFRESKPGPMMPNLGEAQCLCTLSMKLHRHVTWHWLVTPDWILFFWFWGVLAQPRIGVGQLWAALLYSALRYQIVIYLTLRIIKYLKLLSRRLPGSSQLPSSYSHHYVFFKLSKSAETGEKTRKIRCEGFKLIFVRSNNCIQG